MFDVNCIRQFIRDVGKRARRRLAIDRFYFIALEFRRKTFSHKMKSLNSAENIIGQSAVGIFQDHFDVNHLRCLNCQESSKKIKIEN